MPSFSATLSLSSTKAGNIGDFDVLRCVINTGRPYDTTGLPSGKTRTPTLELDIVISENEVVIASVFDMNDLVKGTIEFKKIDEDAKFRTIKFDKSWIVEYNEVFQPGASSSMVLTILISTGYIEVDGVSTSAIWTNQVG
ncbi:MAG TPA: type VI secretion system tube protein TssD [Puia sp.]|nr:type VI secretion system tube protein TssD [Puia sp.]